MVRTLWDKGGYSMGAVCHNSFLGLRSPPAVLLPESPQDTASVLPQLHTVCVRRRAKSWIMQ